MSPIPISCYNLSLFPLRLEHFSWIKDNKAKVRPPKDNSFKPNV